jgi:hypothetical protein
VADDLGKLIFIGAVIEAGKHGDKRDLLALLRADYPLTAEDKTYLANLLDGKIRRERGRPRARNGAARDVDRAVAVVKYAKHLMRQRGQTYRIHNRALDLAFEWLESKGLSMPSRQAVENRLRRASRRKSRAKSK